MSLRLSPAARLICLGFPMRKPLTIWVHHGVLTVHIRLLGSDGTGVSDAGASGSLPVNGEVGDFDRVANYTLLVSFEQA